MAFKANEIASRFTTPYTNVNFYYVLPNWLNTTGEHEFFSTYPHRRYFAALFFQKKKVINDAYLFTKFGKTNEKLLFDIIFNRKTKCNHVTHGFESLASLYESSLRNFSPFLPQHFLYFIEE